MSVAEDLKSHGITIPIGKYQGHAKSRRPEPDSELTTTGPGTLCGEYLRCYWQPVCMTSEIPDDRPLRLRIMSEDLVAFKDKSGTYGLLAANCSHRNTSLEFGIIEENGIRCCYHGWRYDIDGTILEAPGEPDGTKIPERVKHGAYPVLEYKGLLFAYMGPPDEQPDFPIYDIQEQPNDEMVPYSITYPCNWLQVMENTVDPIHTVFLHTRITEVQFANSWGAVPVVKWYTPDNHIVTTSTYRWGDYVWLRSQDVCMPNHARIGAFLYEAEEPRYFWRSALTKWTVPRDDTECMIISWRHYGPDIDPDNLGRPEEVGKEKVDFIGQTMFRDYIERQIEPGDYEAQVSQGLTNVHAAENLGQTDVGVATLRKRLRDQVRGLADGSVAPVRPQKYGDKYYGYVQDTVFPIPARSSDVKEDEALRAEISDAAMDIILEADSLPTAAERSAQIKERLKKLHEDPRFCS
jgi:nitrite reductase/ring-hydroxylating ferredoxin subunit